MQSLRVTRFPTAGDDPSFSLIRPSVRTGAPSPAGGRTAETGSAGTSSGTSRHLSTLRCPKNAAGLRFPLHFSTAAEKEPSLYPPLAARGLLSPVRGEGFCRAAPLRRFATPLPDAGRGKRCEIGIPRVRGRLLSGGPSPSLCDTAPRRGERQAVRDRDSPCAGGDEGDADDTVELSFLYEHMDHIFSFCLNFSALPSLLSFLCSCIITISVHFCALL